MKFFTAVALILVTVARSWGQSVPPASGVALYSGYLTEFLPNNSFISSDEIGHGGNSLSCYTAAGNNFDLLGDASWTDVNGDSIPESGRTDAQGVLVLYTQRRAKRLNLNRGGGIEFTSGHEGVYTCRIDDENGERQTLFVGIYTTDTIDNSDGPVVHSPVFSLLTNLTTHPSQFTVTCPSSSLPPLNTVWSTDSGQLTIGGGSDFEAWQVMLNASTSRYDNVLHVSGDLAGVYTCQVHSDEHTATASLTVQAPSGPPENVRAVAAGAGSVLVSWTQPQGGASGYAVVYRPTSTPPSQALHVRVEDAGATNYTIQSVETEANYTVQVLAYIHLPSSLSQAATVYLDVPGRPRNVAATPTSSSSVRVRWAWPQNAASVEGYIVRYQPSVTCEGVSGEEVTVPGAGVREWEVTGLEEGVEYEVRVAAFNSIGTGPFSQSPATVSTEETAPSGAPLSVSVTPLPPTTLLVSWQPPDCLTWNSPSLIYTIAYHSLTDEGGRGEEETVVSVAGGGFQFNLTDLDSLTLYNVSVRAGNGQGSGPASQGVTAIIITAPGPLESVNYQPDILSILLSWDLPQRGRGYITTVTLEYYNSEGVKLGTESVSESRKSYRLGNLQPLSTYDVTLTPHTSDPAPGPTHRMTVSTIGIGIVTSVGATVFNSSTVNVSWTPLPSIHVTSYTVYYSQLADEDGEVNGFERFVVFPVEGGGGESGEGWGLVGGLEEGREYMFSVAAVVAVDGGTSLQGEESQPVTVLMEESGGGGDQGFGPVILISSAAGALLLVLVVIAIIIIIIISCLTRRYHRSGKMEVASAMELQRPYRKSDSSPVYDPPTMDLGNCRPEIVDAPKDIIAVEGERVDFRLKVVGSPEPSVLWYHNGCMVGPDYATEISNDGGLTLISVEPNHEGTYRYTVSNCVGSIQGKVTLYVTSETSGWGQQRRSGMDLPVVSSRLVNIEQFDQYMRENGENEGRGLRDQFLCLSSCEENHSTSVALSEENKKYNRFTNIVPYDDNRVKLKPVSGREDCQHDYINASYIDGYGVAKKFVATQGPTDATVVDFWRMAWQLHCPTVVMMTNLQEGRKKCEQYWPQFGSADYGPYSVTLAEQKILADYTIRKLTLTSSFSNRRVHYITHYQFTSWQDHRVPECASPLLEFHCKIHQNHRPNKGPIILHCSAGVGRTGAFILLDTALGQASGERRMDLPDILTRLRNQRMKLVQTPEQYIFVHKTVLEALTCVNTSIESAQLGASLDELSLHDPQLGASPLEEEFAALEAMTPRPEDSVCRAAQKYSHKNRNHDYLPTDQWRVVLKGERPDYINACFGCDYHQKEAFIITQAPLDDTCRDFWKMVYERECGVIVMLSGLVEGGRVVCQRYWPTTEVALFGEYVVTRLEEQHSEGYLERIFSVTDSKGGQAHYVSQFQVLGWYGDGRASSPVEIVNCMLSVESARRRCGETPVVVHCSDGVTRSGMFCAAMAAIQQCQSEDVVDVFKAVRALRQQRPGAVPHTQHYTLLYKLLLTFIQNSYSGSFC